MKVCSIEGCERKYRCCGFCMTHYNQERRKGGSLDPYIEEYLAAQKRLSFLKCLRNAGWTEERYNAFNYAPGGLCYLCRYQLSKWKPYEALC